MAVARITEVVSASSESFHHAITTAVERAAKTLRGMTGLKVVEQKAKIVDGTITEYRVHLSITFVLDD